MTNIFSYFLRCFYDRSFYHGIISEKRNKTIAFAFILALAASIPAPARFSAELSAVVKKGLPAFAAQIPDMKIRDGILAIDRKEAAMVELDGQPFCLIDPYSDEKSLEDATEPPMIVTRTQIIMNSSGRKSYPLSTFGNFDLNAKKIQAWASLYPLLLAFAFLGSYAWCIACVFFVALVYAVVAIIASKILKISLDFAQAYGLALVAMVPSSLLGILVAAFDFKLPARWLINLAISAGFIVFGLKAHEALAAQESPGGPESGAPRTY